MLLKWNEIVNKNSAKWEEGIFSRTSTWIFLGNLEDYSDEIVTFMAPKLQVLCSESTDKG